MTVPPDVDPRILVVDDEEANLLLLRRMLQRAGYERVETIRDSSTFMDRFRADPPDLVLLDLHMPDPDGIALLAQIDAVVGDDDIVPVLVLTADVTTDATEAALGFGAHDVLTKPFHYPELLLRVRNLLAIRSVHTRVQEHDAEVTLALADKSRTDALVAQGRVEISERVDAVLAGEVLTIVYQPVVDLLDGTIVGAEALSRFTGPEPRPPDVWFREADQVGRRLDVELFAIRLALERLDELPVGSFLSLNASPATLGSPQLAELLDPFPGWRLVIELTEHEPIVDYPALDAAMDVLRDRGVRLAVDDTGSGFSSLHHILRLSPDIIKLDRALLTDIDTDPARRALMAAMVHFTDETGTLLIGEGIETEDELGVLRSLGLRHGQGYLLARPGPLPLSVDPIPGLRTPVPPRPTRGAATAGEAPLSELLHDGPVQELSAACLRLQLLQERTTEESARTELAVSIGNVRRCVAQLGEIGTRFDAS